jgi:uncharacterized membrane protein YecN with MAPEG domain
MPAVENLNVSLLFIAVCAGSLFFFGAWIGPLRGKLGVLRGDGGDAVLFKRTRIHGNFVENAPLFALVLVAAELLGATDPWLWLAVACFFVGRAYHYLRYDKQDRSLGLLLTTAPALALGIFVAIQLL